MIAAYGVESGVIFAAPVTFFGVSSERKPME